MAIAAEGLAGVVPKGTVGFPGCATTGRLGQELQGFFSGSILEAREREREIEREKERKLERKQVIAGRKKCPNDTSVENHSLL